MSQEALGLLDQLEDYRGAGTVSDGDYKQLKWRLLVYLQKTDAMPPPTTPEGDPVDEVVVDSLGKTYVYIPAEPFLFGAGDDLYQTLAPVYMAKYPVTVGEFIQFVEAAGYDYPQEDLEQLYTVSPDMDCPATQVSWLDAKEYCRWLRRMTQEYYSLPNEFEWEKAARGLDGRFYPWGNTDITADDACFEQDGEAAGTVPVQTFAERNISIYGCCGMVGNVWEFTLDSFDDPRDPHILRGGAWCNPADFANTVARTYIHPPERRCDFAGFRVVYLTNEMLVRYRQTYAEQEAGPSPDLRVVGGVRTSVNAMASSELEDLGDIAAALEAAQEKITRAATAPGAASAFAGAAAAQPIAPAPSAQRESAGGLSIQELMAQEISSASEKYKQERAHRGEVVTAHKPLKKRIKGVAASQPGTSSVILVEGEDADAADEQPIDITAAKRKAAAAPKTTAMTYAAFGVWCAMFLSVIGLCVFRLINA